MSAYILVVDDNPNNLRLLLNLLSEQGYDVRPANSGSRALATIEKAKPALVLLDIRMPDMDGYEVCQRLKAQPEWVDIPVLFISANDEVEDKVKGFAVGAVDYIPKPFEPQELFARVRTHLELKQARDQLKALNADLQSSNDFLNQLNQLKDEFLGMVSHDLKNPLSSILLFSRYMESRSLSDEKAKEIGRLITRSGRHMFQLIEDLLELNKLDQGQFQLQIETLSLEQIWQELLLDFEGLLQAKQQHVNMTVSHPDVSIKADSMRLRQICENLLSNAIKFSPSGGLIEIKLYLQDQRVITAVCDHGPGISESDQSKLFQRFARLSTKPTAGEHSSGLGLSIVKKLVEVMQGEIWYEANQPQGSCFVIAFAQTTAI